MVTTHQQAEFGRIETLLRAEQIQHHRRQLRRKLLFQRRSGQRRLIRSQQQLQRGGRLRRRGLAAGVDRKHLQPRTRQARLHQPVEPLHQRRRCAEVVEQLIDAIHPLPRCEIGVEITAAKAVDGLLGIAHQQQQVQRAVSEGPTQHPPLHRVRVLKFIHHHGPIALLERQQPGGFLLTGIQGRQQATKGDHAPPPTTLFQFSQTFLEQVRPDPFDQPVPERGNRLLQCRGHQAGGRLATFASHAAPTAGVEIVLQGLFDGSDRFQRWQRALLLDPLLHLRTAIRTGLGAVGGT